MSVKCLIDALSLLADSIRPPALIPALLASAAALPAPPSYDAASLASTSAPVEVPKTADQIKKEKEEKLRRLMGGKLGGKLFGKKK